MFVADDAAYSFSTNEPSARSIASNDTARAAHLTIAAAYRKRGMSARRKKSARTRIEAAA